jgi:hypothetical protein
MARRRGFGDGSCDGRRAAPWPENQAAQSWTTGAKDLAVTALRTTRMWATMSLGTFTEVYWPAVGQPQVKDFGLLIGGAGRWREVKPKPVDNFTMSTPDPALMLPTIVHRGTGVPVDAAARGEPRPRRPRMPGSSGSRRRRDLVRA